MSNRAREWVYDFSKSRRVDRLVLLAIAECADADAQAFPGFKEIARMAGVSRDSVKRSIAVLEELGEVEILEKGGGRRSSTYLLPHVLTTPPRKDRKNHKTGGGRVPPVHTAPGSNGAPTGGTDNPAGGALLRPVKEPPLNPHETDSAAAPPVPLFDEFWERYPEAVGMSKPLAKKAWDKLDPVDQVKAFAALTPFREYCETIESRYIPHAKRFLAEGLFDHWVRTAQTAKATKDDRPIVNIADHVDPSAADRWREACSQLVARHGIAKFNTWFSKATLISCDPYTVYTEASFTRNQIEEQFRWSLSKHLSETVIVTNIDDGSAGRRRATG